MPERDRVKLTDVLREHADTGVWLEPGAVRATLAVVDAAKGYLAQKHGRAELDNALARLEFDT
jgi:hypothetical protein